MMSDGMMHYKKVDVPMGEFWLRSPTHDKPNDMMDAISAAHIYGKPVILAEAFTELRMAWDEYPGMVKIMQDRNYALGINKLGADTEYGSSLIIMSIVGGAILPRIFGYISDATGNIQYGYVVPFCCFVVIALFGYKGYQVDEEKLSFKTSSAI
jgi:hypothetical protein